MILDGLQFQHEWLKVLSARTDNYLARWSEGLQAHS
jgi:hypothetical protein